MAGSQDSRNERFFQEGLASHREGRFPEAACLHERVLATDPHHGGAWHFLGVIALSQREYPRSIGYLEQALSLCGTKSVCWNNYGAALREVGRHEEAGAAGVRDHYTECLWLFDTTPGFESFVPPPPPAGRSEPGLPESGSLDFCPHRLPEYHPMFDESLQRILAGSPTGHLVILGGDDPPVFSALQHRLKTVLGKTLSKRLVFLPRQPVQRYYRILSLSTMIPDSPVYAGGITAFDAFFCGVPCVTQEGGLLVQRYSSALCRRMGMADMVPHDREGCVSQAVRLGTDAAYRRHVRERIVARRHIVFEDMPAIREYEHFFERVTLMSQEPAGSGKASRIAGADATGFGGFQGGFNNINQ